MLPISPRFLPRVLVVIALLTTPASADTVGLKIRLGAAAEETGNWSGMIEVSPGGVSEIEGWRFEKKDVVIGANGWRASTRSVNRKRRSNHPEKERSVDSRPLDNGVTVRLSDVTEESVVTVRTLQGEFEFTLKDVPYGTTKKELEGRVEIERTAASQQVTRGQSEDDFPVAAVDREGHTQVAWIRFSPAHPGRPRIIEFRSEPKSFDFLAEPSGGDQVFLGTLTPTGIVDQVGITDTGRDVFGVAVAIDGDGHTWVLWGEKRNASFEVWARSRHEGKLGEPVRISTGEGNQHSPVATTDANGRVWVAWQGLHEDVFGIFLARQRPDGTFGGPELVSARGASSWAPAIAATPAGADGDARVAVVWDTYAKGDYDLWLREYDLEGRARDAVAAANDPDYQARASAAYDRRANLWLAWELGGPTWGKDTGLLVKRGTGLLSDRRIGMIVRSPNGTWLEPASAAADVMPVGPAGAIPKRKPGEPLSEAARAALPFMDRPYHNLSRLTVDVAGRVWLLFRSRAIDFRPTVGSMWLGYAAYYENGTWTGPILLPQSSNLLYSPPTVVAPPSGGIDVVHPTDHRQNHVALLAAYPSDSLDVGMALTNPWTNDLVRSTIEVPGEASPPRLVPASNPPDPNATPSESTEAERANIAHARTARATVRGEDLTLLRGEFHRHTEFSSDGGSDGPLQDMWRYAIDVSDLDWVGNGDHDNGHNRPYPWWLIQKTTDAFQIPDRFTTVFSYERSRPYPEGHRNVVFKQRGVRPLPRLPLAKPKDEGPAPDTEMYYRYLAHFGGISAPHTTGTSMGTDWRNRNDEVEPVVEIYQGSRHSYEMPGAPRTMKGGPSKRSKGFVSHALAKGYRLGFVASSDHHSTHISYAMLWLPEPTREAILEAFRKRRVYAATDDIVADVRMGTGDDERFMGEELEAATAPVLRIRLDGTAPFAKVVIVKDGEEVHTFTPEKKNVRLEWTDPEPEPGVTSHYYVRGEQQDNELVWTSPIWVEYEDAS